MTKLTKTETDTLKKAAAELHRAFDRYDDRIAAIRQAAGAAIWNNRKKKKGRQ